MASLSYRPQQNEQPYYLGLFRAADTMGNGVITGVVAVKFFGRSKLPVEVLKNIWTVADQPSTSTLDLKKFAVAVRLIQLTQNGQKGTGQNLETPPGVVLKPVFFEGISGVTVQMPPPPQQQQQQQQQQQGGLPPPHPTPHQPNRAMPPPQQQSYRQPTQPGSVPPRFQISPRESLSAVAVNTPSTPSRALVGMDPYALSPQERQRYESLFPSYAKTEEDGSSRFVYGSEAVPLFMKSGVDPNTLRDIWNMVDRDPVDNRLDKLEFALAMHLIVCVSKKNLPLPQGGQLPPSLQALKASESSSSLSSPSSSTNPPGAGAPSIPNAQAPAPTPLQQNRMMPPPPQAETTVLPPAPDTGVMMGGGSPLLGGIGGGMGGMSISDAFEGMDSSQPAPEPAPTLPSYVPSEQPAALPPPVAVVPEPLTPQQQQPRQTYVEEQQQPPLVPEPDTTLAPVETYLVSDSHIEELNKLKSALLKLQAENVSLKAQLGNMTEEDKQVQQQLGQTVSEITSLSSDLGKQRQLVLEAKNSLLEAKAELRAQKETKGVLTGLIAEAKETKEAIESATETIRYTAEAQQQQQGGVQNTAPPPAPQDDLFDTGFSNGVGAAPPPAAENPPAPSVPEPETFVNEQPTSSSGGDVLSLPAPQSQPNGDIVVPDSSPQEQPYSNYAPPVPPQTGGYPGGAPMPPQTGGYPIEAPMPPQTGGYPAQAPMPPEATGYTAQAQAPVPSQTPVYTAQAPLPPQGAGYPASAPMPSRKQGAPGHTRDPSDFNHDFLMGGSAQAIPQDNSRDNDNFSQAARSMASTGDYGYDESAYEIVEDMKKKAKTADGLAREAESAYRKLAAEADELRTDADRAEANARSLAAATHDDQKKKKRFGGNKKDKKKKEEAEQAKKDSAQIKSHFMSIQGQALEAQTVASQTRAEADRLRDEAEAAELDMAAAASKKQKQPASALAPAGTHPAGPAHGYGNPPKQPNYGSMPPQGQMPQYGAPNGGPPMMPPNGGGYSNYANGMGGNAYGQPPPPQPYGAPPQMSLADPSQPSPGVMTSSSGDYGGYQMPPPATYGQMPPPANAPIGGDLYASPF